MSEEPVENLLDGLDFSSLRQMGSTEDDIGLDTIESITATMSFKTGPLFDDESPLKSRCTVFVTYTPDEDSEEDVYTHRYKVGLLYHPENRIKGGRNEGEIPHQYLPGTGESNGDGFPVPCNYFSESVDDHFGVSIIAARGSVESDPKFSAKSGWAGLLKSLASSGVKTELFPEDLSALDGRFNVKASRKPKEFKNDKGEMQEYSVFTVDEVISDTPPGAKKSIGTSDISESELDAFKVYVHTAITDSEKKDDVGRSLKTTLTVALMRAYPGGSSSKYVAALANEAIMASIGVEIVANRYGIKEE